MNPKLIAFNITRDFEVEAEAVIVSELSIKEQFQLMSTASLAISGCGGVSWTTTFMPENAASILMTYYVPENRYERMEGYIFDRITRVKTIHYPMTKKETVIPEGFDEKKKVGEFRESLPVSPNWEKLSKYIAAGLSHSERVFGWENSFKRVR